MPSLIELGTLTGLDVLAADLKRRIEARGFAEPKAFLKMAEQVLVNHPSAQALVLPAGTVIEGDLLLDYDGLDNRIGTIAVLGDLEVKGRIVNEDSDGGPFFFADGHVAARQIALGGASFVVLGSVRSAGVVFCDYNHGTVLVGGDVVAPAVITNDLGIEVAGTITGPVIGDDEGNMRDMLVADVFEDPGDAEDQWPVGDLIRERLAAGLPILK